MKRRRKRLAGTIVVKQRAKGKCFREFRGRANQIEICLEAIDNVNNLITTGKKPYFSEAAEEVANGCVKMPLNDQIACATGATEALIQSKWQKADLEGRKRRKLGDISERQLDLGMIAALKDCDKNERAGIARLACQRGVYKLTSRLR